MVEPPQFIELEPTFGCNLRCRMCHVSFMKGKIQYLDLDRVDLSFCRDKTVSIGAIFEPCIHPQINRLIDTLNKLNAEIVIITNGHNLDKKEIPALFDSNLKRVYFSFDGISQDTYEEIRVGGNFERTLDNITRFRDSFSNSDTYFSVSFTVMKSNLHEVSRAPLFWEVTNFDGLGFITMVVRELDEYILENSLWNVRESYFEQLELARQSVLENNLKISISAPYLTQKYDLKDDVVLSGNPNQKIPVGYQKLFQYGSDHGVIYPCKSPFVAARILYDGSVFVCHDRNIGNLYESDFDNLWNGPHAAEVRATVQTSTTLCDRCDYFKYCISGFQLDSDVLENYFYQPIIDGLKRHDKDFFSADSETIN